VFDFDFAEPEAAIAGKDRNEAMALAVDHHFVQRFAAIALHAAVDVVQSHAGQPGGHAVVDARSDAARQFVLAMITPSSNQVPPFPQLVDEQRQLFRLILKVAIQRSNDSEAGALKPRRKGCRLAEVAPKPNVLRAGIASANRFDLFQRVVCAAFINEDDLIVACYRGERFRQPAV
jgi:hypothetical protein